MNVSVHKIISIEHKLVSNVITDGLDPLKCLEVMGCEG